MYERERTRFNIFLTMMRKAQDVTLAQLGWGLCSVSMLKRIETGDRLPDKMLRDRLLDRLGVVNDGFADFLWPNEYTLWQNRQKLLCAIADKDIEMAEQIISQYEQQAARNKLERQFYLVMRAQVMQYQNDSQDKLRMVYYQALHLTLPGCSIDQWKGSLLSVQEWDMLLEYIRCGGDVGRIPMRAGDTYQMAAYEELLSELQKSSMDIYCLVKIYPKAAYYLCIEWLKAPSPEKYHDRILQVCSSSIEMLRSTKRMFYLYELLEIMEQTLAESQRKEKALCESADTMGMLPEQVQAWRETLSELYHDQCVPERMENCVYLYWQTLNHNIGNVVRKRRKMLGIAAAELCRGICDEKTLRRLESGKYKTQREIVEELFVRLGLSPEYQCQQIVTDSNEALILYDEVCKALNNRDVETAERILPRLKELLPMEQVVNQQTLGHLDSLYLLHSGKITIQEFIAWQKRILEYTVPLERIRQAEEGYLTCGEMECLHCIASWTEGDEKGELIKLSQTSCEWLITENSIGTYIGVYELLMNEVSSYLGNVGEYDKSDKISDMILKNNLVLRRMTKLHRCVYNNLWNHLERFRKSASTELKSYANSELQKCIRLARLDRQTIFEEFYVKKQKEL